MVWFLLYNSIVVPVGWLVIQALRLFDPKVRRGVRGRKHLFQDLERKCKMLQNSGRRVWFHSSSMGEFEQAKPIIAELKKRHPDIDIIVSFFSPSGYEHSQLYRLASVITYLPFDSYANAQRFVGLIKPTAAVIIRYDVWPNHLRALNARSIPTFIVNATLRRNGLRELPLIKQFHRALYNSLDYILTVSETDKENFTSYTLQHPVLDIMGDTRYDQVWRRSAESKTRHLIPQNLLSNKKVFVVGSSWQEDEERLFPAVSRLAKEVPELLVVLVPHEPNLETLERIEHELNGNIRSIRFSDLADFRGESIVIIDSVGILMTLYRYAHLVYVGGSFHQGVHNVLEPASYGVPIIIGPKHENSHEALELVSQGAAFVARETDELRMLIGSLLADEKKRSVAGRKALELVERNTGATERFLSYLEKVL